MRRSHDARDLVGGLADQVKGVRPVIVGPPTSGWDPETDPDVGPGTFAHPFHLIANGIRESDGKRPVYIRGGTYVEDVDVTGVHGPAGRKCLITGYRNESVTIDGYLPELLPADHWVEGDAPGELVWDRPFDDEVSCGAFLDSQQHTRLVTYGFREDLVSANELDPRIEDPRPVSGIDPGEPPPGDNHVWVRDPVLGRMVPTQNPRRFRNWVYMGPGIWFDPATRLLHLRLSPTHHGRPGWPAYDGSDPHHARLALSRTFTPTLRLTDCSGLHLRNITVRFGGRFTVLLTNCHDLELDHVDVHGSTNAIRLQAGDAQRNDRITLHDCRVDGGLPTWFFRSDIKDGYSFVPAGTADATESQVSFNPLGSATSNALLSSRQNADATQVHHCELVNAHDMCLFGTAMRFHHNWLDNINDDALFMGSEDAATDDLRIYRNVLTRVLTALSFASRTQLGSVRIFRNLFDLREPTLGIRPRSEGADPLRQGFLYKSNGPEGPIALWHNTCLVLDPGKDAVDRAAVGYGVFKTAPTATGPRRSYNNVFVACYPDAVDTKAVAHLPLRGFHGASDGNLYHRVGPGADGPPERFVVTGGSPNTFDSLEAYSQQNGSEGSGILADPLFRSIDDVTGDPDPDHDDLRPRPKTGGQDASPAKGAAVTMPDDLVTIDREADQAARLMGKDLGCYWSLLLPSFSPPGRMPVDRMSVGVRGRQKFPR